MYSNKESVNILTALLVAHGVKRAVVCPGSRNAPIVHNLNECPAIKCYPSTDERSAGFFALGIAQATDEPVVVCVTSGTALLNLAPAVAEAHYQHQSLIVISADRPAEWIDQLDGQTLRQPGALEPWVKKSVTLPDLSHLTSQSSSLYWHCNRLVNEALIEATDYTHACVHINVPLSEPLFRFTVEQLPEERVIRRYAPATDHSCLPQQLLDDFFHAKRPLIVFGQLSPQRFHYEGIDQLFSHVIVLHEALAPFTSVSPFEEVLTPSTLHLPPSTLHPDFILHVGDAIVSKQLKHFLREATDARTWRISLTGDVEDTFLNLRGIVVGDAEAILQAVNTKFAKQTCPFAKEQTAYRRQWLHLLSAAKKRIEDETPDYSEAAAVQAFERRLQQLEKPYDVLYANSTAIRLANRYAQGHPVWCNRGTNGIEGCLSTAVGFAASLSPHTPHHSPLVFCVIGDLSFFYDQNALWNTLLPSLNLRILLLNNGHGAIFDHLSNLSESAAADSLVAGRHHTTAEGACLQHGVSRRAATNMEQLHEGIAWLTDTDAMGPRLLEMML